MSACRNVTFLPSKTASFPWMAPSHFYSLLVHVHCEMFIRHQLLLTTKDELPIDSRSLLRWCRLQSTSDLVKKNHGKMRSLPPCDEPQYTSWTPGVILNYIISKLFTAVSCTSVSKKELTIPHSPERSPPHRRTDLYCSCRQWSSLPGMQSHLQTCQKRRMGWG